MHDDHEHGPQDTLDALEGHAGFVAPRYRSGQRTADALLEAGRALLTRTSYEALSVSDLCKEASLTTGAFYRRFESKESFFLALQRLALDDAVLLQQSLLVRFDNGPDASASLRELAAIALEGIRVWYVKHRGVLRASMQRLDHEVGGWRPFRELGRSVLTELSNRMMRLPELESRADALARLKIAFQIVNGALVNAALNDPGPLRLEDPALATELAQTFTLYVCAAA